jgi:LPP20 lipoprotein
MKLWFKITLIAVCLLFVACAGTKPAMQEETAPSTISNIEGMPRWFEKRPVDDIYLYGIATSTSKGMQLAVDKAKDEAMAEIAQELETKILAFSKKFDEEIGYEEESELSAAYTRASKTVTSTTLNKTQVVESPVTKTGSVYRAYVWMQLPVGEVYDKLQNQIEKEKILYQRFRATETWKELEAEGVKYEKWKKEKGMP